MSNNLRTRNEYPFNFEDGLKAKGKHVAFYVDSIADLKALDIAKLTGREVVEVLGYYAPGDNGGGVFYWDIASVEVDNSGTVIKPVSNPATGRWKRNTTDTVSVKWFGAKGDGVTDDTAAIQAAVNSIPLSSDVLSGRGGYVVFFPAGVYLVTDAIVIGSRRLTLRGSGIGGSNATIIKSTAANKDIVDAGTSITDTFSAEYLQFQGGGSGAGTGNGISVGKAGVTTVYDSRISHCWFTGIPNAAIQLDNASGMHIHDNGIENSVYGIRIAQTSAYELAQGAHVISNNRFYTLSSVGIFSESGSYSNINGNIFDQCGYSNPGDATGAIVFSRTGSPELRGSLISGNVFYRNMNDILLLGNGSASGHTGVTANSILNNASDFCKRRFFYGNSCASVVIRGNTINDANQDNNAGFAAIEIVGASSKNTVANNATKGAANYYQFYGLLLGAVTTGTIIGENDFAAKTSPISVAPGATFDSTSNYTHLSPVAATLVNSWINTGSGYANAGFYKDASGIVHLVGSVGGGTSGTVAFNLPTGYRPTTYKRMASVGSGVFCQVTIAPGGNVTITGTTASWVSLDGLIFAADS